MSLSSKTGTNAQRWGALVVILGVAVAGSCGGSSSGPAGADGGAATGGSGAACPPCTSDSDCKKPRLCGQFGGDTFCAPSCANGELCAPDRACTTVASAEGAQVQLCVPLTDVCGGNTGGVSGSGGIAGSGGQDVCGTLDGPSVTACCSSCTGGGKPCQANGCYGGWWCNTQTCKCQAPPGPCPVGSGGSGGGGGGSGGFGAAGAGGNGGSVTGISGGLLDTLSFAIVGDTRPPTNDDTSGYPTAVIGQIWQDVQAQNPRPAFAVSTGDYVFAKPSGSQGAAQLDLYLGARSSFTNVVFAAMGNHECTGATASNCGPGTQDGITNNYAAFLSKMLNPLGVTEPYFMVSVGSTTNAWTAKLVFVAANAWTSTQAAWFSSAMAQPTTYTFVVRHEGTTATTAPGVTPSAQIMAQYPYTLLIAGHTHTYAHYKGDKEVIVGNGGAPLSGGVNYGYVVARQRSDGAIEFTEYDYATNAANATFALNADGAPTQ